MSLFKNIYSCKPGIKAEQLQAGELGSAVTVQVAMLPAFSK